MAHKTMCGPDWRWENPAGDADFLNLWCVVDGQGTLTVRGRTYQLRAGDCFVLRMREYCLGEHNPEHPLTVLWALYRYRHTELCEEALPPLYRQLGGNLQFFSQIFSRAIQAFNADGERQDHAIPWMSTALMALDEQDSQPEIEEPERDVYNQIQQICLRIQAEPGRQLCIAELAEECHYTPGHFTRLFRRFTGMPPREYVTQARIDAAKSLLYISNYSIGRIAELLGYRDIFFFSRQFREKTGMSPSAFRRR
ncbi:MAG TPA: AraC family transcriptional regulator [Armatimonadota bacterium]|nr:AraC family transcriptional regulator [Armatimonadota bacterium]